MTPWTKALRDARADEVAHADAAQYSAVMSPALLRKLAKSVQLEKKDRESIPRNYRPHLKQRYLHAIREYCGIRIRAAVCGRRAGKTFGGAADFAHELLNLWIDKRLGRGRWLGKPAPEWRPGRGAEPRAFIRAAVVAPTYALLNEPKIALQAMFGGLVSEGGLIVHQTKGCWWLAGGIRIDWLSADIPDRLVSHEYDAVWFDEAARIKASAWTDNMAPALASVGGSALFTSTPLGKNWLYETIWSRGDRRAATQVLGTGSHQSVDDYLDPEVACIAWTTAENTAVPRLAAEMEAMKKKMPLALWERNFLASFSSFLGQCFELRPDYHRTSDHVPNPLRFKRLAAGFDIGMAHKSAFALVGELNLGGWTELGTKSARNVLPHLDNAWDNRRRNDKGCWTSIAYNLLCETVGEGAWQAVPVNLPADRPDVYQHFERCGFNVQDAYQEHDPAVSWMQIALANRGFTFRTDAMWNCLESLHFPQDGESSKKLWVDENDDEWDALRYALSEPIYQAEFVGLTESESELVGMRAR